MATQQFEWTQPVGGKKILWRPLKVGDHMDLDANYGRSDLAHMKRYATLAARIVKVGDKDSVQVNDLRDWDEYDLIAFNEEVESRELARSVALMPQRPGGVINGLEQAVSKAQLVANELGQALTAVLQRAKEVEQKIGPLGSK